jgi:hypothetical protein
MSDTVDHVATVVAKVSNGYLSHLCTVSRVIHQWQSAGPRRPTKHVRVVPEAREVNVSLEPMHPVPVVVRRRLKKAGECHHGVLGIARATAVQSSG